jgi:hypothetical protein
MLVVRPDLRRDGRRPRDIRSSGERERCGAPRGNIFTMQGEGQAQSLVGNPVPRDKRERTET